MKLHDPRAKILYVDTRHGKYMMTSAEEDGTEPLMPNITNEMWSMECDGISSSSCSGARIVLISQ